MIDLQELQLIAQLVDNLEILTGKLEKAYATNNTIQFNKIKQEILEIQKKISTIVK